MVVYGSSPQPQLGPDAALVPATTASKVTADRSAALTGLAPGTTYYYVIVDAAYTASAGPYHFRTPPAIGTAGSYRVWWLGDPGMGDANQAAVRDAYLAASSVDGTDVMLSVGDNAYTLGTDAQFGSNFFAPYAGILSSLAVMAGTGGWACCVSVGGGRGYVCGSMGAGV